MKRIIVFNGVSTSGKTTIAETLAKEDKRLKFFSEIGEELREKVDYGTLVPEESFDLNVMKKEFERDKELLVCKKLPLVESWHIGNMAYILIRNPHLFDKYKEKFKKQLSLFEPKGIIVDVKDETFRQRIRMLNASYNPPDKEKELLEFNKRLREHFEELYKKFDIEYVTVQNDKNLSGSLKKARREIIKSLSIVSLPK